MTTITSVTIKAFTSNINQESLEDYLWDYNVSFLKLRKTMSYTYITCHVLATAKNRQCSTIRAIEYIDWVITKYLQEYVF